MICSELWMDRFGMRMQKHVRRLQMGGCRSLQQWMVQEEFPSLNDNEDSPLYNITRQTTKIQRISKYKSDKGPTGTVAYDMAWGSSFDKEAWNAIARNAQFGSLKPRRRTVGSCDSYGAVNSQIQSADLGESSDPEMSNSDSNSTVALSPPKQPRRQKRPHIYTLEKINDFKDSISKIAAPIGSPDSNSQQQQQQIVQILDSLQFMANSWVDKSHVQLLATYISDSQSHSPDDFVSDFEYLIEQAFKEFAIAVDMVLSSLIDELPRPSLCSNRSSKTVILGSDTSFPCPANIKDERCVCPSISSASVLSEIINSYAERHHAEDMLTPGGENESHRYNSRDIWDEDLDHICDEVCDNQWGSCTVSFPRDIDSNFSIDSYSGNRFIGKRRVRAPTTPPVSVGSDHISSSDVEDHLRFLGIDAVKYNKEQFRFYAKTTMYNSIMREILLHTANINNCIDIRANRIKDLANIRAEMSPIESTNPLRSERKSAGLQVEILTVAAGSLEREINSLQNKTERYDKECGILEALFDKILLL